MAKGHNNVLMIMNDTDKDIVLDLPPHERIRMAPHSDRRVPTANDDNIIIRFKPDGTVVVGAKMYAEVG